jgi:2-polyprenyl-6-methoxyphenol hydroxylase-like FAD-dependent oxidoreductase
VTAQPFDVIVVGARCAGATTAMLLARKGYRVLVVDRASFPSDTVSTHVLHPPGAAALLRWGLLDRLAASGCPPIRAYTYDFGRFTIAGAPGAGGAPVAYCPRRTILDEMLADAATEAGAELREGCAVEEILVEDGRAAGIRCRSKGGGADVARARVIVGADGRRSMTAATFRPESYDEKPPLLAAYYAYWSGLPMDGRFETYIRDRRGFAAAPTHDGLTVVIAGWPYAEFAANKKDIEGNFLATIGLAPDFADRLRRARRESRFAGAAVPNYFRRPYGSGWALVGDAGYNRDFITGQGMTDAFLDAELCVQAIDQALWGRQPFEAAMARYQQSRDARVKSMYDYTCQLATLDPPPPDMQRLFAAIHGNRDAMDGFARMNAGTISPAEFFAPGNVARILEDTDDDDRNAKPRAGAAAVPGLLMIAALLLSSPGMSSAQALARELDNPARQPFQAELQVTHLTISGHLVDLP